jgi:uncharacterized membrane protein HdeD (DUF308 family)
MPRFSIKDLMLAITLVAVGLSIEIVVFSFLPHTDKEFFFLGYSLMCSGLATIVAGLSAPFHKKKWGAAIGFVVGVAFTSAMWFLAN